MTILYLDGLLARGIKRDVLRSAFGADCVDAPELTYTSGNGRLNLRRLWGSVRRARKHYRQRHPEVLVASSLGAWVALQIVAPSDRLVLVSPAWKKETQINFIHAYARRRTSPTIATLVATGARWLLPKLTPCTPAHTVILHAPADETVPIADSRELLSLSGRPLSNLIEVGDDHSMETPAALEALVAAVQSSVASRTS